METFRDLVGWFAGDDSPEATAWLIRVPKEHTELYDGYTSTRYTSGTNSIIVQLPEHRQTTYTTDEYMVNPAAISASVTVLLGIWAIVTFFRRVLGK